MSADIGILLDHNLKFNTHVALTVSKATQVLGFIERWAKEKNYFMYLLLV